jgi:hypothetical protein
MPSPFPGMDPYLESFSGDFHHTMIARSSYAIQKQLPKEMVARIDVREFVEPIESWPREEAEWFLRGGGTLENCEPSRQGFVQIIDRPSGRRVVTVIEVLKPSNKVPGPGRDLYLKKQEELKSAGISSVEIDLNRTGSRIFAAPFDRIPHGDRTPFAVSIRWGWKPLELAYYSITLSDRLPVIPIPLRQSDRDMPLDLQSLVNECFVEGRYDGDIDYRKEPDPPLSGEDAQWADKLLREQGRR